MNATILHTDSTSLKPAKGCSRTLTRCYVAFGLVCLTASGCSPFDRSAQFIPSPHTAKAAIQSGMESWKKGDPVGVVGGTKPVIHVVDSHRKAGQTLSSYEILGEVAGNAPRCFAVKVKLTNPEKEEKLRYLVVGIDPLWVFRQEDYDLMSHWEHPMEETKKAETPTK